MNQTKEKLFSQFPEISTQEWMQKIEADLKGAPFDKKLVWRTNEGFNVNPFYRAEDIAHLKTTDALPGEFPYVRGTKVCNSWYVRQDINVTNAEEANAKMKELLGKGITSFGLKVSKEMASKQHLTTLLDGIDVEKVELNYLSCRTRIVAVAKIIVEIYREKGVDLAACPGSFHFDVFKKQLSKGVVTDEWIMIGKELLCSAYELKKFTVLDVAGISLANAGAFVYQELGFALSAATTILDTFVAEGCGSAAEIAPRIRFDMGVGTNYFMELAKFRALRWLWAEIVGTHGEDCKGDAAKAVVHAETSSWNMSIYDAYVNMLRTQTEAMSATLAGVHSLTVLPFDAVYKESDEFSERIARNQQLLLKEECHFDRVVDPGAGSYYIEHLTSAIAEQAWKLFLHVEEDLGGFAKAANEGAIQAAVNESNQKRHKDVATRRESLLGTNIFPNFSEMAKDKITKPDAVACGCEKHATITALDYRRGGSDFELLRLATEEAPKRPLVFMLTIGNLAMRLARSQFSSNFFAVAGYEVKDNLGFNTVQEGVDAAMAAMADVIVLCSSDDEYAEYAPQAYEAIAGRVPFVVAGAPACMEELKEKGIEHFIHVKVNVLETLQGFHKLLGIQEKK